MPIKHIVQQGECLPSIAKKYGFADYRTIYDHPLNAEFKRKRPDPHVLQPGDVVWIPNKEQKQEQRSTEQIHRFQARKQDIEFKIQLTINFKPISNAPYKLEIATSGSSSSGSSSGSLYKPVASGTTNADGWVKCNIPVDASMGRLIVDYKKEIKYKDDNGSEKTVFIYKKLKYLLFFGYLNPIDNVNDKVNGQTIITCVQQRLNNLGYYSEQVNGKADPATIAAIKRFQADHQLKVDGLVAPNGQTATTLKKVHKS
jgi:hypothetical protein